MEGSDKKLLDAIAQRIYDKKGFNILALDIREVSTLYEFLLIAEGNVERHVQALAREIIDLLGSANFPVFHVEGTHHGDWIVLDAGTIVIHLFVSELREKYALETMWKQGEIVDLRIDCGKEKKDG